MSPKWKRACSLLVGVLAVTAGSCSKLDRQTSPVLLQVTAIQTLNTIDLLGGMTCTVSLGSLEVKATEKNTATTGSAFNDVRLTSYRVSYARTDGGKTVPAPFVRSISALVPINGSAATVSSFVVLEPDAAIRAPFAALLPVNGGRDPDTGRPVVKMDIIVEVFGQTLAGENVSASTRFPLDFCYNCMGCK
jgi:hypothetical protein